MRSGVGPIAGADGWGTATAVYGAPPQHTVSTSVSQPESPVAGSASAVGSPGGRTAILHSPSLWLVLILAAAIGLIRFSVSVKA